ncbi:TPA: helix-turn-helix domain-containing protein, partial [Streptococcus equi subsp. equi]|nr:helix-turn-helix domain-containing protein [Streptococcus equi subsp. equi]
MILGETYRKMREEKGISISSLAGYEISKSQISRFELGETEISIFKLLYLLEKLGITFEEFLLACNNYEPSEFNTLIKAVQNSAYNNKVETLISMIEQENKLFEETNSHYHKLNSIFIQSIISGLDNNHQLTNQDISYLSNYLFSLENWGYYETLILGNCCRSLPPKLLFKYTKEALKKGKLYNSIPRNKQSLIQLLLNSLLLMIENDFYEEAIFLNQASKNLLSNSTYFFELTILLYLEGYLELKFNIHTEKSNSKIEEALKIFNSLN